MRPFLIAASAAFCVALLAPSLPADAQSSRAHLQRAEKAKAKPAARRGTNVAARRTTRVAIPELQDRTRLDHPNGRLNGQALFDSISERTSGAGE